MSQYKHGPRFCGCLDSIGLPFNVMIFTGSPVAAFGGGYVMVVGREFKDSVQRLCNQSHTCTNSIIF